MDLTGHGDGLRATDERTENQRDIIKIYIRQTGQDTETEDIEKGRSTRTYDKIDEINVHTGQTGQKTETEKIETDENIRILDGHLFLSFLAEHVRDTLLPRIFESH